MILALVNVVAILVVIGVSVYLFITYLDVNTKVQDLRKSSNVSSTTSYKINSMSNVTVPVMMGTPVAPSTPKSPPGPPAPGTQTTSTPSTSTTTTPKQ